MNLKEQQDALKQAEDALSEVQKRFGSLYDSNSHRISDIMDDVAKDFGVDPRNMKPVDASLAGSKGVDGNPVGNISSENKSAESGSVSGEESPVPETDPMEDLDNLIGLSSIKHDVKELYDFVKVQKMRQEAGMKTVPVSLHMVFSGNPGTGKTTVARIIARLYHKIGVLSKGQLVEVDRSGLVAGYVGQTAIKTRQKIKEAMGGVLFVDEAYALARDDSGNDFGQEAIDTILKAMEDHRDDFVVIVAGYTKPMEKFIHSNPGLESRFNKFIEFPDYTMDELMQIFQQNCEKYRYQADEEAFSQVRLLLQQKKEASPDNFANAREVRNLFETIVTNQARRVAAMEHPTKDDMQKIILIDTIDDGNDAEGQDQSAK